MRETKLPRSGAAKGALLLAVSVSLAFAVGAADEILDPELRAALAVDADVGRGRSAYEACAVCHGPNAGGRPDGTFPRLAGQHARVIMKQVVDIRSRRRENPIMHPHALRLIDSQEIADVSVFVSLLPPPALIGMGPGKDLDRGERIYRRDCMSCHGARAEGDAPGFIPSLAGQHYAYLLRQIREIGAGRRGNAHPEMAMRVSQYGESDLKVVVDYASRVETTMRSGP